MGVGGRRAASAGGRGEPKRAGVWRGGESAGADGRGVPATGHGWRRPVGSSDFGVRTSDGGRPGVGTSGGGPRPTPKVRRPRPPTAVDGRGDTPRATDPDRRPGFNPRAIQRKPTEGAGRGPVGRRGASAGGRAWHHCSGGRRPAVGVGRWRQRAVASGGSGIRAGQRRASVGWGLAAGRQWPPVGCPSRAAEGGWRVAGGGA